MREGDQDEAFHVRNEVQAWFWPSDEKTEPDFALLCRKISFLLHKRLKGEFQVSLKCILKAQEGENVKVHCPERSYTKFGFPSLKFAYPKSNFHLDRFLLSNPMTVFFIAAMP